MPTAEHKNQLKTILQNLAKEFDAPDFDPHVTLYHGRSNREEAQRVTEEVAKRFSACCLDAEKLDQSSKYSKTFFIQFHESSSVYQMYDGLRGCVTAPSSYVLNPHMSLLYKSIDEDQRQALCQRDVPLGTYRFDEIWAVEFDAPWSDASARNYRVVATSKLKNV